MMSPPYLLLFVLLTSIALSDDGNTYDVIIMGAGISGISAATTLYKNGITNIIMVEAQDYIGGRMKTIEFNNYTLSIGASWLSGACTQCNKRKRNQLFTSNPILELAEKYNIKYTVDNFDSETLYPLNHEPINHKLLNSLYKQYYKARECIQDNYVDFERTNNKTESYRLALQECGWKNPTNEYSKFVEWYEFDFEFATDPEYNNAFTFEGPYQYYGTEDLYITDPRGYAGVTINFAKELMENGIEIKLNEPITAINYNFQNEEGIIITTQSGNQYHAKYGIITFSMGVLQSDLVQFQPALPEWKLDAIQRHVMVDYLPIYIAWPYDFWSGKTANNGGTEQLIFIDEEKGYFVWTKNLNHNNYFPGSNMWRIDVTNLIAKRLQNQKLEESEYEYIHDKLTKYFDVVPEPLDMMVANWTNNKYTKGAFVIWSVDFTMDDWERIRSRVDNLFFCGEGTSFEQYGYVSGAYLEGITAAEGIIACLKDGNHNRCTKQYNDNNDLYDEYHSYENVETQQENMNIGFISKVLSILIAVTFALNVMIWGWRICIKVISDSEIILK